MKTLNDLWTVFWNAFKETPKGMFVPFAAFFKTALRNPVLYRGHHGTRNRSGHLV